MRVARLRVVLKLHHRLQLAVADVERAAGVGQQRARPWPGRDGGRLGREGVGGVGTGDAGAGDAGAGDRSDLRLFDPRGAGGGGALGLAARTAGATGGGTARDFDRGNGGSGQLGGS